MPDVWVAYDDDRPGEAFTWEGVPRRDDHVVGRDGIRWLVSFVEWQPDLRPIVHLRRAQNWEQEPAA